MYMCIYIYTHIHACAHIYIDLCLCLFIYTHIIYRHIWNLVKPKNHASSNTRTWLLSWAASVCGFPEGTDMLPSVMSKLICWKPLLGIVFLSGNISNGICIRAHIPHHQLTPLEIWGKSTRIHLSLGSASPSSAFPQSQMGKTVYCCDNLCKEHAGWSGHKREQCCPEIVSSWGVF